MQGLMMDFPLLTSGILRHACRNFKDRHIVTRSVEGPVHRYTLSDAGKRIGQLANALVAAGVKEGDRVGVIGWNTYRQFELYYAVSGIGAVLHTVNPRLGLENAAYVINHAGDTVLFYDTTFAPLVEALAQKLETVAKRYLLTDAVHAAKTGFDTDNYEDFLAGHSGSYSWPSLDENTAASMCYTSGTTGKPKGVLYSHRSIVLQAFATVLPNALSINENDTFLPVVPMFHVNAWNSPYSCLLVGAKQVFPGPGLDGASLYELFEQEKVTYSAGVPSVWLGLLDYLKETGKKLRYLRRGLSGGAALSEYLVREFEKFDLSLVQGWGMTEMSPVGTANVLPSHLNDLPVDDRLHWQLKAGRALPFVDMKITGRKGETLPCDGVQEGHLHVRGPWVAERYYREKASMLTQDGWFDTGDVATIDEDGYMKITDRAKDLVKSGGEWVSSVEIENAAMMYEGVLQAAVIGVPHPKWQERPLLIVVKRPGSSIDADDMLEFLRGKLARISMPDAIEFIDFMPLGATGKILKKKLRETFRDYRLPGQEER